MELSLDEDKEMRWITQAKNRWKKNPLARTEGALES